MRVRQCDLCLLFMSSGRQADLKLYHAYDVRQACLKLFLPCLIVVPCVCGVTTACCMNVALRGCCVSDGDGICWCKLPMRG